MIEILNMPIPFEEDFIIFLPRTRSEIVDKAAGPYLYSPDRYPYQDFKPYHLQQTHDSEFMLLHKGVDHVFTRERYADDKARMHVILDEAYGEFLTGDDIKARGLIQEFIDLVQATK